MISNYLKTSLRQVSRNKLFSAINIVGLAVGMSVGLLLIAFLHDVWSYDRFHEHGTRVYRITTDAKFRDGYRQRLATTSLKAGKRIPEISGVQQVASLLNTFSGDARFDDRVVPISGMYADPSALQLFTFPLLQGDATSALTEPNSIVLTETAATKLFGSHDVVGKSLHIRDTDYQVTGLMKDVPFFSHLRFEALVSWQTIDSKLASDVPMQQWSTVWERNYVYVLLEELADLDDVQAQIDAMCREENRLDREAEVRLSLLPLHDIVLGEQLTHSIGPVIPGIVLWIVGALATVVILSACFNYTNLSIARSMRRFKEVGLRKVIGAGNAQVRSQFLSEALLISFIALVLSTALFLLLRPLLLDLAPELTKMIRLDMTWRMTLLFVLFSIAVGVMAGSLPAMFFARVRIIQALRDGASVKVFRGLNVRRMLVVVQYTLTLIFITSTVIGYVQYQDILAFDLGFNTRNILNISLLKNKPDILIERLKQLPEVSGVSQSRLLTSVGNVWGAFVKYKTVRDSALVLTNIVDENYLPLHNYRLVAGQNFTARPLTKEATSEVIVNEKTLRQFNIADGNPATAIGEEILLNNHRLTIVGVIKDFHYGKLDQEIHPVAFTYMTPDAFLTADGRDGLVNVLVNTSAPTETMARIEQVWKSVDPVHPFDAEFYDDSIRQAYSDLSAMVKVIGLLSAIAVSIASLGLLGMVVYTTETRLREISVRKVLGASSMSLVLLLSRGFLVLLAVSAIVALPATYLFFEKVILVKFPFHNPVGAWELVVGLCTVLTIAFAMIGSQTVRAARSNPASVLKGE